MTVFIQWAGSESYLNLVIGPRGKSAWVGMAEEDDPTTGQPYIDQPTVPAMVEYLEAKGTEAGAIAGAEAARPFAEQADAAMREAQESAILTALDRQATETARDQADASATAAVAQGPIHPDLATGLALTAEGQQFRYLGADLLTVEVATKTGGVAVPVTDLPTGNFVRNTNDRVDLTDKDVAAVGARVYTTTTLPQIRRGIRWVNITALSFDLVPVRAEWADTGLPYTFSSSPDTDTIFPDTSFQGRPFRPTKVSFDLVMLEGRFLDTGAFYPSPLPDTTFMGRPFRADLLDFNLAPIRGTFLDNGAQYPSPLPETTFQGRPFRPYLISFDFVPYSGMFLDDGSPYPASSGGNTASTEATAGGMIPYLDGGTVRAVGATDEAITALDPYDVIAIAPGAAGHARAVIDWPAIGPNRSVAVAPGSDLLVPDAGSVLHVIIMLGQSLAVGAASASTMISVVPVWPEDALMFLRDDGLSDVRMGLVTQDGGTVTPLDPADLIGFTPLIAKVGQGSGSRGQTAMESMANGLAQRARDIGARFRSLSFTAAMGGTDYEGLKKGSQTYSNMLAALAKAKALAEAQGWKIIVDGCLHKHGESDSANTLYLANLIQWQSDIDADVKAITGQQADVHFIMGMPSSMVTSVGDRFASVKAMLAAHNSSPFHHLAGPDYPFGDAYYTDFVHGTGPFYFWVGEQMERAWTQALWSAAGKSKIVQMLSAVRTGNSVVINYEVPAPPLVFDTTTVTERDVKGFRFFDSVGEIVINSATITGPAQVTLALASTPSGSGEHVDYAFSLQPSPRTAAGIVRGNLRDSATDVSRYLSRPLWNWAVHQTLAL
ncbi:hypothetical protein [Sphingobium yanoikuyae]|uniref:hypothetical protein n=1 Tax=Sphingobium yanoikuyae TaxID=13690 RepID=UPI0026ED2DCF|nr:hypothetical protein [Sphingobium yanoikuyae]